jgi:hypothetical protein
VEKLKTFGAVVLGFLAGPAVTRAALISKADTVSRTLALDVVELQTSFPFQVPQFVTATLIHVQI